MRLFALLNFQHVMAYLFIAAIFMVVFGLGLAFTHWYRPDSEQRKTAIANRFREEIADRNGPFPLIMLLIIVGTVIWAMFYTLVQGRWGNPF